MTNPVRMPVALPPVSASGAPAGAGGRPYAGTPAGSIRPFPAAVRPAGKYRPRLQGGRPQPGEQRVGGRRVVLGLPRCADRTGRQRADLRLPAPAVPALGEVCLEPFDGETGGSSSPSRRAESAVRMRVQSMRPSSPTR